MRAHTTCGFLSGFRPAGCAPNDFLRYAKNNRGLISLSAHIDTHACTHLSNPLLFDMPLQAYLQLSIFLLLLAVASFFLLWDLSCTPTSSLLHTSASFIRSASLSSVPACIPSFQLVKPEEIHYSAAHPPLNPSSSLSAPWWFCHFFSISGPDRQLSPLLLSSWSSSAVLSHFFPFCASLFECYVHFDHRCSPIQKLRTLVSSLFGLWFQRR